MGERRGAAEGECPEPSVKPRTAASPRRPALPKPRTLSTPPARSASASRVAEDRPGRGRPGRSCHDGGSPHMAATALGWTWSVSSPDPRADAVSDIFRSPPSSPVSKRGPGFPVFGPMEKIRNRTFASRTDRPDGKATGTWFGHTDSAEGGPLPYIPAFTSEIRRRTSAPPPPGTHRRERLLACLESASRTSWPHSGPRTGAHSERRT